MHVDDVHLSVYLSIYLFCNLYPLCRTCSTVLSGTWPYIYMYIHIWWCLFCSLTQNRSPRRKGRGALVVPLPSRFERPEYLQTHSENNDCVCGVLFLELLGKDLENRHVSSDASRHFWIANAFSTILTIDSERGACCSYEEETTCENSLLSRCMTIFTRSKAPAAAILTNTQQ